MNARKVTTLILLLFVAASIGVLIHQETTTGAAPEPPVPGATAEVPHRVVVYYFHGQARCTSCRTIETYAHEAIMTGFTGALRDQTMEWRTINVQEPGNDHYIRDYHLSSQSVVLVEMEGDKVLRWQNLDQVWMLLRNKDNFILYVRDETQKFLEAAGLG